jgi:hypothetical protein
LQDSHCALHVALQQTPSAQVPERHSSSAWQVAPFPLPATQTPLTHNAPEMQSALVTQPWPHAAPWQLFSPQLTVVDPPQWPEPSQLAAVDALPLPQVAGRQVVPPLGKVQAVVATPLQKPPHTPLPPQDERDGPTGAPLTGSQVPSECSTLQASHCPPHARLQQ